MSYYDYAYPYPSAMFTSLDPWRTTLVPQHFPEHHYPFEKARHAVGTALSSFSHALGHHVEPDPPIIYPRADIQETIKAYYLDVELPGVKDKSLAKLEWVSGRTLLVTARNYRPKTGEEEKASKDNTVGNVGSSMNGQDRAANGTQSHGAEEKAGVSSSESDTVYLTVRERQVGKFARAFSFPTGVDHAQLKAVLHGGVMRITLPKLDDVPANNEHKKPEIHDVESDKQEPARLQQ